MDELRSQPDTQEDQFCSICNDRLREDRLAFQTDIGLICRSCYESAEETLYAKAKTVADRLLSTLEDEYKAVALDDSCTPIETALEEALQEWREENR